MFRVSLVCVGRMKAGADRDLSERYVERARLAGKAIGIAVDTREIDESRARQSGARKAEEAAAILAALASDTLIIALDERGAALDSASFAALLAQARDSGVGSLALVIGGADGLDEAFRKSAKHVVAFGAMTWPHQLVRIMASEQIYRAITIIAGHPYHRA